VQDNTQEGTIDLQAAVVLDEAHLLEFIHAEIHPGLDRTPVPHLALIDPKHYSSMTIQFSRGCLFNCEFCDMIEVYGRKLRTKSPAQTHTQENVTRGCSNARMGSTSPAPGCFRD
jgi:radical SAM superfamily enzyme YgiQ (UPF0313 family)